MSALLAFTTLIKSLQLVSPNLVASLRCSELVMAFGVQSLITMEAPSLLSCLGAVLINLGVIILAYHVSLDISKLFCSDIMTHMSRRRLRNLRIKSFGSSRILEVEGLLMKIWSLEDYLVVTPKLF